MTRKELCGAGSKAALVVVSSPGGWSRGSGSLPVGFISGPRAHATAAGGKEANESLFVVRLLNVARESCLASRLSRDAVLYRRPHAVVCFDVSRVKAPWDEEWSIGLRPGAVKRRTPSGTSRERSLGLSRMRRISSNEGRARERRGVDGSDREARGCRLRSETAKDLRPS